MSKLSVSEALKKVESGELLASHSVDFDHIRVEALDALKLGKGGVDVPENVIYYDDDAIVDDEDFEGDWKRIHYDPVEVEGSKSEIKIEISKTYMTGYHRRIFKLIF